MGETTVRNSEPSVRFVGTLVIMRHSHGFFSYINTVFGQYTTNLLKSWIKLRRDLIKIRIRTIFLKFCIQHNITPPHSYNISRTKFFLSDHRSKHKLNSLKRSFITKLIKIELNDAYRMFYSHKTESFHLVSRITKHLPFHTYKKFFRTQESSLFLLFQQEMDRLNNKMYWLLHKHKVNSNQDINAINYWAHTGLKSNSSEQDGTLFSSFFSFSKSKLPQDDSLIEIKITPSKFSCTNQDSSLTTIRNK